MRKYIKVHKGDNVAVALVDLKPKEIIKLNFSEFALIDFVKQKHKFTLEDLQKGDKIVMYGFIVGEVQNDLKKGSLISTSNTKHFKSDVNKTNPKKGWNAPDISAFKHLTFDGYHRNDGQVGTQNVWLFFPLVFCENRNIEILKDVFEIELLLKKQSKYQVLLRAALSGKTEKLEEEEVEPYFDNIEVKFITHQGGCGGIRQDSQTLAKLLAGYINNPNVAGATVLSLGCQNLQIDLFKSALNDINPTLDKPVLFFEQQQMGTVDEMLSKIIKSSIAQIKIANEIKRSPAPLSYLNIGLECGGSDGFSGISANPLLGEVSDILVSLGAKVMLSEFPELCGVEQDIVDRCESELIVDKFIKLMNDFEQSAINAGSGFDMNPSPGNIKDGLITDAMKSAGAARKGGTSLVKDVLDYAEYIKKDGLTLLCTPGNDVESTTAMAGSGANIILFTTGLGTPTGNPITPVIKVSSNSKLAQSMPDIIDFNSGKIITGEKTLEESTIDLLNFIINVASGKVVTKASILNQNDFIPWKRGVSL